MIIYGTVFPSIALVFYTSSVFFGYILHMDKADKMSIFSRQTYTLFFYYTVILRVAGMKLWKNMNKMALGYLQIVRLLFERPFWSLYNKECYTFWAKF